MHQHFRDKVGCQGGGADVHDIVADEQRGERFVEVVQDVLCPFGPLFAVFSPLLDVHGVDRCEGGFGSSEVAAAKDQ